MATITEKARTGGYIKAAAPGTLSHDVVTIASGEGVLEAGTVLAKLSASGKYVAYDDVGTDGSETAAAILYAGVDATSADVKELATVRLCEVWTEALVWKAGVNGASQTAGIADLATKYVIAR